MKQRQNKLLLLCLAALGICLFGHTVTFGFVEWDDPYLIVFNDLVHSMSWSNLVAIFSSYDPELYIPLTFFSYQIDFLLSDGEPWMFHATNVLLHIANTCLVFLASKKLFTLWKKNVSEKEAQVVGAITALLFMLHPIQAEAIAWASSRKDLLFTVFYLASLYYYLIYREEKVKKYMYVSLVLFVLSLLSKIMAITLPIVLLLVDYLLQRTDKKQVLSEKIPYGILAGVFLVIGIFGKLRIIDNTNLLEKLFMACKSTVFYVQHIVWPTGYAALHPYTEPITITSFAFAVPVILTVLVIGFIIAKRTQYRLLFFSTTVFLVTLAPTFLNFAKAGNVYIASDRYVYISVIGLFFGVGVWLHQWVLHNAWARNGFLCGIWVLGMLCHLQVSTWQTTETMAKQVLRVYPDAYKAHDFLGTYYKQQGSYPQAEAAYLESLKHRPDATDVRSNLGSLYATMGKPQKELEQYEIALQHNPNYVPLRYNLAMAYLDAKRIDDALVLLEGIVEENANFAGGRAKQYVDAIHSGQYE